jgi:hypothetical protein
MIPSGSSSFMNFGWVDVWELKPEMLLAEYYKADNKYCCCRAKRRQFLMRLAFSMTINKSMGQAFDKICV